MSLVLDTPRLTIRRFRPDDLEAFLAYRNDPEVARYQSWNRMERDEAERFIAEMATIDPSQVTGRWVQLAIEPRGEGIAGDCAFVVKSEKPMEAVIGFTLARHAQGRGLATEAVGKLLEHLFRHRWLHRVVADTDPSNTASWRLLERVGMRREAHRRQSLWFKGAWAEELVYAMLACERRATRQA